MLDMIKQTRHWLQTIFIPFVLLGMCHSCLAQQVAYADNSRLQHEVVIPQPDSDRRISLRTNALGYAFLVTNLGVEVPVGGRVSLSLPVYFSAFNYFHRNTKYRCFGMQPGVRCYIATYDDVLRGMRLFVGGHFNLLWFNYANGGTFRYQDEGRHSPLYGLGIDAGVKIPFFHKGARTRWGLELQAGIGWNRLHIDEFVNIDNGMLTDRYSDSYFGIDNLAISIYYVLGKR